MFPSKDLREYVRMLRKIERAPAESPQTSAAIRSLERSRKNRASKMLAHSREILASGVLALTGAPIIEHLSDEPRPPQTIDWKTDNLANDNQTAGDSQSSAPKHSAKSASCDERQTISEVLHDIYDKSVQ
jgi:hypothetical protein